MITSRELIKIASAVEEHGFSDDKAVSYSKLAIAKKLSESLASEIETPPEEKIEKVAAASSAVVAKDPMGKFARMVIGATGLGLGLSITGRTIDSAEQAYDKFKYNKKKKSLAEFARKENPALKKVSDERIGLMLDSLRTIAPRAAKDPMLASSFLNTAHAVGGVDFGTAKTLADIQSRGGKSYDKAYDAVRGTSSAGNKALLEALNAQG